MVIVILSILAAVAIPIFVNLSTDAKNHSDEYTIAALLELVSSLRMESIVGGGSGYPTMTTIVDNLYQPEFFNGLTSGEWSYLELLGEDLVVIYCPHGTDATGRRIWIYFRTGLLSYQAGSIVEFSSPH